MSGLALPGDLAAGSTVVAAVSGGADSVALLDLLLRDGRFRVVAWHLDHALRPDSAADAAAVRQLADRLGVAAVCERCEVRALVRGDGIEEAGRRARYARLAAACARLGAVAACTAHHRDDQAETAVLQILRGCGPAGPGGIAAERALSPGVRLLRPLLGWSREELRAHCRAHGLAWREDPSNADHAFRRNHIRHAVLPLWERHCPGIAAELAGLAARGAAVRAADAAAAARIPLHQGLAVAAAQALSTGVRGALWLRLLNRLGIEADRARLRLLEDLLAGAPGRRLRLGPWLLLRRGRLLVWDLVPVRGAAGSAGMAVDGAAAGIG